uniref:RNase H type-1 domain-containing protein n=1 Tax=Quercus lobata TaxID=97700 RepID=A0A7N2LF10_QUELO
MLHFFRTWNISGVGAMIRNEKAEVMAAMSAKGPLVGDSEETEVLACRKALEFAIDASFSELVNEGETPMS